MYHLTVTKFDLPEHVLFHFHTIPICDGETLGFEVAHNVSVCVVG